MKSLKVKTSADFTSMGAYVRKQTALFGGGRVSHTSQFEGMVKMSETVSARLAMAHLSFIRKNSNMGT